MQTSKEPSIVRSFAGCGWHGLPRPFSCLEIMPHAMGVRPTLCVGAQFWPFVAGNTLDMVKGETLLFWVDSGLSRFLHDIHSQSHENSGMSKCQGQLVCVGGCGWRERLDVVCGLDLAQGSADLIQGLGPQRGAWTLYKAELYNNIQYSRSHLRGGLGSDGQMRNRRRIGRGIGSLTKRGWRVWRHWRCHLPSCISAILYFSHPAFLPSCYIMPSIQISYRD